MEDRLRKQVEEIESLAVKAGLPVEELAERAAIAPETMRKIVKGYSPASDMLMQSLRNVVALAQMAQKSWPPPNGKELRADGSPMETAPVVSWASAGSGGNYADLADFLDEVVETDCKDPNKYALIVEGDSMEPVFRAGDRIVVSPNVQAQNGDYVVARINDTGEVLFKMFHQFGRKAESVRLTSYNPAYPVLEFKLRQFRFIQPVYSMTRKMRNWK